MLACMRRAAAGEGKAEGVTRVNMDTLLEVVIDQVRAEGRGEGTAPGVPQLRIPLGRARAVHGLPWKCR